MWVHKTTYFVVLALLATSAKQQGPTQSSSELYARLIDQHSYSYSTVVLSHLTFDYWTFGMWTRDKRTPGLVLFAFLHKHLSHRDAEHMGKQIF